MFVIVSSSGENGVANAGPGEMISFAWFAIDRDEKETAIVNPLRNRVRKFFASR
jgi:hypothetical protein